MVYFLKMMIWLVVSAPLKNMSQLGLLFPIYGEKKHMPNHQPVENDDFYPMNLWVITSQHQARSWFSCFSIMISFSFSPSCSCARGLTEVSSSLLWWYWWRKPWPQPWPSSHSHTISILNQGFGWHCHFPMAFGLRLTVDQIIFRFGWAPWVWKFI